MHTNLKIHSRRIDHSSVYFCKTTFIATYHTLYRSFIFSSSSNVQCTHFTTQLSVWITPWRNFAISQSDFLFYTILLVSFLNSEKERTTMDLHSIMGQAFDKHWICGRTIAGSMFKDALIAIKQFISSFTIRGLLTGAPETHAPKVVRCFRYCRINRKLDPRLSRPS